MNTQEINQRVAEIKTEKGCVKVFVDKTYSQPKFFPVYNDGQVEFLKAIFERNEWSRFDELISSTLETKKSSYDELLKIYDNAIDSLD
jgi:hypothetical protein